MSQRAASATACPKCGAPNVLREEVTHENVLGEMDGLAAVAETRTERWTCLTCWHRWERGMTWDGRRWRDQETR